MSNLYDALVVALRRHWKDHNNTYPERFELSETSMQELLTLRKLVIEAMHFSHLPTTEHLFLGVPLTVSPDGDFMVTAQGERMAIDRATLEAFN